MHRLRTPIAILLGALITFAEADVAFADSPNVTAVLSNSEAVVGEMVQLPIKVSGAGDVKPPENILVDGLEILGTGTSREFEMRDLTTTSSESINYTILPLKAGRCAIQPQSVRPGTHSVRTR